MWIFAFLAVALNAVAWMELAMAGDMPIGIPSPAFGLVDSRSIYDGSPDHLIGPNGPYTHYVNNLDSDCLDSGPGTMDSPLCSIPTSLVAGDVVEIHGGPYVARGDWLFTISGTSSEPVFIVGVDDGSGIPILLSDSQNDKVFLDGSYAVFENLTLQSTSIRLGIKSESDHLA